MLTIALIVSKLRALFEQAYSRLNQPEILDLDGISLYTAAVS